MVSKDDYIAWRNQEVTKEFYKDIGESSTDIGAEILNRVLSDVPRDQYLKGFIAGLSSAVSWKPEFSPEEEEFDDNQS